MTIRSKPCCRFILRDTPAAFALVMFESSDEKLHPCIAVTQILCNFPSLFGRPRRIAAGSRQAAAMTRRAIVFAGIPTEKQRTVFPCLAIHTDLRGKCTLPIEVLGTDDGQGLSRRPLPNIASKRPRPVWKRSTLTPAAPQNTGH